MKEKSMKKSVAVLSMGLILGTSVITGCSLVTTDYNSYYNAVAGTIDFKDGSKIEITRKDLRVAYSTYGFNQYVTNYGSTETEAYTMAMDYLVAKKLAIRDVETRSRKVNNNDEVLDEREKKYLWESTVDAMMKNIDSYKSTTSNEETENKNENAVTRERFKREVELTYDDQTEQYSLVFPESAKSDLESHKFWSVGDKDATTTEGKEEIFAHMISYSKESSENKDAYQAYLRQVKTSEKNFNLSTDAKSVFIREIERVYGILYENYMVNKYADYFGSSEINNVLIEDMLELYSKKVRADYATYHGEDQSQKVTESTDPIYYFNDDINWFYVTHILVKFDENEQAEYDYLSAEIKKLKEEEQEGQYSNDQLHLLENQLNDLYVNLSGIRRVETSKDVWEEKEGVNAPDVSTLYKQIKQAVDAKTTTREKIEKFDDFIYEYNEDPGIMNATFSYIVGVDYTKPSEEKSYTGYSKWVESFTDAAIELYDNGNGKVGDIYQGGEYAGLIRSNYGIHIMMYAGEANNLFSGINSKFSLEVSDLVTLYNSRLNGATEKTYFDLIYEECVPNNTSSIFQTLDLDRLKGMTNNITYYAENF